MDSKYDLSKNLPDNDKGERSVNKGYIMDIETGKMMLINISEEEAYSHLLQTATRVVEEVSKMNAKMKEEALDNEDKLREIGLLKDDEEDK